MMNDEQSKQEGQAQPAQQFDTTFKDWIRQAAPEVVPVLLPGAVYEATVDIEIIRPTMRADKVFRVRYGGKPHLLNIEFETGRDAHLASRLLVYNAVLYHDYQLPVKSLIVYPFRTKMAESPLQTDEEENITFYFQTLPLFLQEAEWYVQEHVAMMYPLLPTMRGVGEVMMERVMRELAELYRDDVVTLSQQFVWMQLLLARSDTIAPLEKAKIQERLKMYDALWDENPRVQKIAQKNRAEGEIAGEVQAAQRMLITITKTRFPDLAELAQERVTKINKPDALDLLAQQIVSAPDESSVRWLLSMSRN